MKEKIKFLVDENLLGLLKKLRMMGVDSLSLTGTSDIDIQLTALAQSRVILTKDRRFFNKLGDKGAYFVRGGLPKEQLLEVLGRFPECIDEEPLSRCLKCNTLIKEVEKDSVKFRVDEKTFGIYETFYECPKCHHIYWEGSHFVKLQNEVQDIRNQLGESS